MTVHSLSTVVSPFQLPRNRCFGLGHLPVISPIGPSANPDQICPLHCTSSLFHADFSTVSPRAVTLPCLTWPAAPDSRALRRENYLCNRTIQRLCDRRAHYAQKRRHAALPLCPGRRKRHVCGHLAHARRSSLDAAPPHALHPNRPLRLGGATPT